MRLKRITLVFLMSLLAQTISRNHQHDFPFSPSVQKPLSVSSDNSVYLPLETQTSLPYFPLKTINELNYQYLPLTGTKAPTTYPSPFPVLSSSFSYEPMMNEEEEYNVNTEVRFRSTRSPPTIKPYLNPTHNTSDAEMAIEREDPQHLPRMVGNNHSVDRIVPRTFNPTQSPFKVQIADRRVTKSTEGLKNDLVNSDQIKTGSLHEIKYLPPPAGFVSTTPETAIPILRLSNEMDLDGSYSYEALGADQTHYVQHSRIENPGTVNEEQVVEGSYSYVGDNGRTYTVHYVADGNGFRASGDHLPVPPPIPEIIQRSIEYNLAEEANNPTHSKTWEQEENYNNMFDNMSILTSASTNRNLFTGRKPEAFSRKFINQMNGQDLTVQPIHSPTPTTGAQYERTQYPKHSEPISPQVTFLASQGAHVPLISSPQPPLSRTRTDDSVKEISKLVKYEMEKSDNAPQEPTNKQLWRWQYGITANPVQTSISRSSNENDDNTVINFKNMTPEQYSNALNSHFHSKEKYSSLNKPFENSQINQFSKDPYQQVNQSSGETINSFNLPKEHTEYRNRRDNIPYYDDWFGEAYSMSNTEDSAIDEKKNTIKDGNLRKKIFKSFVTPRYNFTPRSHGATQSHPYEKFHYDSNNLKTDDMSFDYTTEDHRHYRRSNSHRDGASKLAVNLTSATDKQRDDLKSITETAPTTENTLDMLKNNIFLKKLLFQNETKSGDDKPSSPIHSFKSGDIATKKTSKMIDSDYNTYNDIRITTRKPPNAADVLNFVSSKNAFESNRVKPRKGYYGLSSSGINTKHENTYTLNGFNSNTNDNNYLNDEQNERLRSIVRIYKTLQRNNNFDIARNYKDVESRTERSTDFEPITSHRIPSLGRRGPSVGMYSPAT